MLIFVIYGHEDLWSFDHLVGLADRGYQDAYKVIFWGCKWKDFQVLAKIEVCNEQTDKQTDGQIERQQLHPSILWYGGESKSKQLFHHLF